MHEKLPRRQFLKQTAGVLGSVAQLGRVLVGQEPIETAKVAQNSGLPDHRGQGISYPRRFEGNHLKMISFPLGGVAAGSLGLGGRGQLRDWEIFNRPNKGYSPSYAFPAIRVQSGTGKPVARILESRLLPPFEGAEGLGSANASGISRLQSAKFTGAYPIAHIDFEDPALPIQVELDAFSPFIPHDPDDSGLPVAVLRYRVTNSKPADAMVSIAFSIDNPIPGTIDKQKRLNEYLAGKRVSGLRMSSPAQSNQDPAFGTFAVGAIPDADTKLTCWRGWPEGEWWNSPLLFWDTFSADGELGAEPRSYNTVGCLCQQRTIPPGQSASFTFLLGWHFPNRTPKWCSWTAPPGKDGTIIGNDYAKHFRDAWEVVEFTADHLESLETRTRLFARAFRESTVPDVVKEAASANLSTLASTTCFRTGDGEFRAFEGSGDHSGKGYGNCVHVWNYETATAFLFPSFSRSLRKAAFGFSEDDAGAIHARQVLPDGETRDPVVAADGQMGQIMHAFLDWQLSGDDAWLRDLWPRIKKAVAFAWVAGGWDPDKTGVLGGVQNNTYDVAFYGPNPLCAIYYLGALRAAEKMALAIEDKSSAAEYKDIYDRGSKWIEMNLFNGEFYTQQIKSYRPDQVYTALRRTPSTDINNPDYQVGKGCLVDQLTGQYLAHVMNLGNLVSPKQIVTTLQSIYKYNYRRSLAMHDNSARTYALDDEAALVICDYSTSTRPRIPFPYFAEVWSGLEHSTAALMIYCGMMDQGLECITNVRSRYDGEKRNPWNEAEYGHHYARPMAAWSSFIAVSGFHYDAPLGAIVAVPRVVHSTFRCFWSTGTGWGTFSYDPIGKNGTRFTLRVLAGKLRCSVCEITGMKGLTTARSGGQLQAHTLEVRDQRIAFRFDHPLELAEGGQLEFESNP